jgi:hypothetical protein
MGKKKIHVPKYCLHKPSGRAYMRVNGKVAYLGEYASKINKTCSTHFVQPSRPVARP